MSETLFGKKIKDLQEATAINETDDIIIEDAVPKTKRAKVSTVMNAVKEKIASWTFDGLTTNDKTLVGAINEQNGDLPIEQGISENWCYRKWKNGFAECWTKAPVMIDNQSITTGSWAGGYESPIITLPDFPFRFANAPYSNFNIVSMDVGANGDYMILYGGQADDDLSLTIRPQRFKLWRSTTKIIGHPKVSCYAIGLWK